MSRYLIQPELAFVCNVVQIKTTYHLYDTMATHAKGAGWSASCAIVFAKLLIWGLSMHS